MLALTMFRKCFSTTSVFSNVSTYKQKAGRMVFEGLSIIIEKLYLYFDIVPRTGENSRRFGTCDIGQANEIHRIQRR